MYSFRVEKILANLLTTNCGLTQVLIGFPLLQILQKWLNHFRRTNLNGFQMIACKHHFICFYEIICQFFFKHQFFSFRIEDSRLTSNKHNQYLINESLLPEIFNLLKMDVNTTHTVSTIQKTTEILLETSTIGQGKSCLNT